MVKNEALEIIERMPYITTLMIANDKYRLEAFSILLQSSNPIDLVKLIKTDYIRGNDKKQENIQRRKNIKLH